MIQISNLGRFYRIICQKKDQKLQGIFYFFRKLFKFFSERIVTNFLIQNQNIEAPSSPTFRHLNVLRLYYNHYLELNMMLIIIITHLYAKQV